MKTRQDMTGAVTEDLMFGIPPLLAGYTLRGPGAYRARDNNELHLLWIETGRAGGEPGQPDAGLLRETVLQAKDLGCRSVVLTGELPEVSGIREITGFIDSLGVIPVLNIDAALISRELAEFLYAHHASILAKDGSIRAGLDELNAAGFTAERDILRLGANFIASRGNIADAADFWRFCRENRIYPEITVTGTGGTGKPAAAEIREMKLALHEIDRAEYGYDWNVYSPVPGAACLQYLCSMYITREGNARPCACTPLEKHPDFLKNGEYALNIKRRTLSEIYHSGLMYYCRHIDSFLEGKCKSCGFLDECLGCRGWAYAEGIAGGKDPLQALASECGQCFKERI